MGGVRLRDNNEADRFCGYFADVDFPDGGGDLVLGQQTGDTGQDTAVAAGGGC